ncbi:hypothetical protein MHYP_G00217130 [Metynnis hypsauchen]
MAKRFTVQSALQLILEETEGFHSDAEEEVSEYEDHISENSESDSKFEEKDQHKSAPKHKRASGPAHQHPGLFTSSPPANITSVLPNVTSFPPANVTSSPPATITSARPAVTTSTPATLTSSPSALSFSGKCDQFLSDAHCQKEQNQQHGGKQVLGIDSFEMTNVWQGKSTKLKGIHEKERM